MAQLQNAGLPAGTQHTAHLSQSLLKVGEITDAESGGHGVERVVAERQVKTVLTLETDGGGKTLGTYLAAAYLHHAFRYVGTGHLTRMKHLGGQNGKVAGAGGYVEHRLGMKGFQLSHGTLAPTLVDVPRQTVVQLVVRRGDVVEHALHLLRLLTRCAVGIDLLLLVHLGSAAR